MGRKQWNRLTKKGKEKLQEKLFDLQLKLTDLENNYEKVYDLEETINDNIKNCLECDGDCSTCSVRDQGDCLLNFRKANIFFLAKLRSYEEFFQDAVEYIIKFIQGMHQILVEGKDPDEIEDELDQEKKKDTDSPVSMFS